MSKNIWITSDLHFGHKNICAGSSNWEDRSTCRPFSNADEMDEVLIENWNSCVKPEDLVWVLGDWAMCKEEKAKHITNSLNGTKYIVLGNHDRKPHKMVEMGFTQTRRHYLTEVGGLNILMHHKPRGKLVQEIEYDILLHGHQHSRNKISGTTSINMCVEAWDYTPVPAEEVYIIARALRDKNRR